jgi:hypothetical protein
LPAKQHDDERSRRASGRRSWRSSRSSLAISAHHRRHHKMDSRDSPGHGADPRPPACSKGSHDNSASPRQGTASQFREDSAEAAKKWCRDCAMPSLRAH